MARLLIQHSPPARPVWPEAHCRNRVRKRQYPVPPPRREREPAARLARLRLLQGGRLGRQGERIVSVPRLTPPERDVLTLPLSIHADSRLVRPEILHLRSVGPVLESRHPADGRTQLRRRLDHDLCFLSPAS